MPVAPPAAKALTHMTGKTGQTADNTTPDAANTTLMRMIFCKPLRSL
jgi:hypothetical protein